MGYKVKKDMVENLKDMLKINNWGLEEFIADTINKIKRHLERYSEDFNDLNLQWCYSEIRWLIIADRVIDNNTDLERIKNLLRREEK